MLGVLDLEGHLDVVLGALALGIAFLFWAQRKTISDLQADNKHLREKIDTVWDFQMRRAQAEVVMDQRNSVEASTEECQVSQMPAPVLSALGNIAGDLRTYYRSMVEGAKGRRVSDNDAMLGIEKRFGGWLVQNLCVPHNQTHGECLIYALTVAKG